MAYTGRKEPLRASATRANLSKDGKVVTLIDNVKLIREATAGRPEMTLTTSTLTLRPDDETATTDAPVTITHGKSVIRGTGFDYNNITAVAILRASVRGTLARGG